MVHVLRRWFSFGGTTLLLGVASTALAQRPPTFESTHAPQCRQAVQDARSPGVERSRSEALELLSLCELSGPPVFARLWIDASLEPASLGSLVGQSARLRDVRLYRAVTRTARDVTSDDFTRAAALAVLGRWATPGYILGHEQFFEPGFQSITLNGIRVGGITHDTQHNGGQPLEWDIRREVLATAESVLTAGASYRLRAAAQALARHLQWSLETRP